MNLNGLLNIHRPYRTLIYLIETQASASAATWAMIQWPFRPWAPFMQQRRAKVLFRFVMRALLRVEDVLRI